MGGLVSLSMDILTKPSHFISSAKQNAPALFSSGSFFSELPFKITYKGSDADFSFVGINFKKNPLENLDNLSHCK